MKLKFLAPGDPKLLKRSKEVKFPLSKRDLDFIDSFRQLILPGNLVNIHAKYPDCVGMAAPQVGYMKRIILVCPDERADKAALLINPEIVSADLILPDKLLEETVIEGCFSVSGWYDVTRFTNGGMIVKYQNIKGETRYDYVSQFSLRVLLHEIDHLDGKLISHIGNAVGEIDDH